MINSLQRTRPRRALKMIDSEPSSARRWLGRTMPGRWARIR